MPPTCAKCDHGSGTHYRTDRGDGCSPTGCTCSGWLDRAPSVPVGGLPDGSREGMKVPDWTPGDRIRKGPHGAVGTILGVLHFEDTWLTVVRFDDCGDRVYDGTEVPALQREAVPVVPEPGRWYANGQPETADKWYFCLPDGSLILWTEGDWWTEPQQWNADRWAPLVECEPPAEFRDGQQ